jgi:hypothetical protein
VPNPTIDLVAKQAGSAPRGAAAKVISNKAVANARLNSSAKTPQAQNSVKNQVSRNLGGFGPKAQRTVDVNNGAEFERDEEDMLNEIVEKVTRNIPTGK